MNTNNVLTFPKNKIVREGLDFEPVRKAQERSAQNYAESVVNEAADAVLEILSDHGLELDDDTFKKDFAFTEAVMTAAVYRSLKLPHRMHPRLDEGYKKLEAEEKAGLDPVTE
jgi:hypothetical protein